MLGGAKKVLYTLVHVPAGGVVGAGVIVVFVVNNVVFVDIYAEADCTVDCVGDEDALDVFVLCSVEDIASETRGNI